MAFYGFSTVVHRNICILIHNQSFILQKLGSYNLAEYYNSVSTIIVSLDHKVCEEVVCCVLSSKTVQSVRMLHGRPEKFLICNHTLYKKTWIATANLSIGQWQSS